MLNRLLNRLKYATAVYNGGLYNNRHELKRIFIKTHKQLIVLTFLQCRLVLSAFRFDRKRTGFVYI